MFSHVFLMHLYFPLSMSYLETPPTEIKVVHLLQRLRKLAPYVFLSPHQLAV